MKIRADFAEPVAVAYDEALWTPSPMPGVERLMLDRIGGEVARATSLVRYAAGSRFSAHSHELGEEYFVLDGTFSDETGDFPAGTYVRNPPGSGHAPHTDDGCTIFVKLRQFQPDDDEQKVIDTTMPTGWQPTATPGIEALPLHRFAGETVRLERWQAGVHSGEPCPPGGCEMLIVDGSLEDGERRYGARSWLRWPGGAACALGTAEGATVLVKEGHLPPPEPA